VFYLADIARSRGDLRRAEAGAREYKRLAERMIATDPSNPKWQMEGIYAENDLGALLNDEGRYSEAAAVFANTLADRERLAAAYPENEQYRIAAVEALSWLGDAREKEGRLDDALAQRERQIAILEPIIARANIDVEYRRQAMVAYRAAGRLNALRGDMATGVEQLLTSIGIGERLLQAEPSNTEWMARTGGSKFELARVDLGRNVLDEAAALARSGCDISERLIAKDPTVVEWRVGLRGDCLELTTRIALGRGSVTEAHDDSADMVTSARAEFGKSKSDATQLSLVNAYVMSGIVAQTSGNTAQATSAFRNAATAWPSTAPDRPGLLATKVVILAGVGRNADAADLAARLERMGYGDRVYLSDARKLGIRAQERSSSVVE
jgi:tetratricopeptide (TPR) repeat protein